MSVIYLDIATIPDFELGARLYNLHELSEEDIARVMVTKSRENDINRGVIGQHMQRLLSIAVLMQDDNGIKTWSVGAPELNEAELLKSLQELADEHKPAVVSWDGNRSIFPLLNYRYLSHGLRKPLFSEHTNLITELAATNDRCAATQHEVAALCGFSSQKAMSADDVLNAYLEGSLELIHNELELNVVKIWLLNQRWQLVCGKSEQASQDVEFQRLKEALLQQDKTHLTDFAGSLI